MWTDVNIDIQSEDINKEDLLQFQVALNRSLSHALSYIRNNQIINIEANKITTNEAFITNAQIGSLSADKITAGFLELVTGLIVGTADNSVSISKDGITITNGKITITHDNAETVIDQFGINPKFLDYSKNLIWNSSFEVFDSLSQPYFWRFALGTGDCNPNSSFYGDRSLRLASGAQIRQTWAARVKPWFIQNQDVRVSMYINFEEPVEIRVVDIGTWEDTGITVRYFKLWDGSLPKPADVDLPTTLTFNGSNGWEGSRISFVIDFDATGYTSASSPPSSDITAFALEIKNVGTGDVYIDGVMAHVDFTGSWAQIYKGGPKSIALANVGSFWTDPDLLVSEESEFEGGIASSASQVTFDNVETGMLAENVQDAIDELFIDVDNGKELIADAIFDRGIIASKDDTFEELAAKILMLLGNVIRQLVETMELLPDAPDVTETVSVAFYTPIALDITESITSLEDEEAVTETVISLVEEEV